MDKIILHFLSTYSLRTISLTNLEKVVPGTVAYEEFAGAILQLITDGVLVPIKAHGTNLANPPLPNGYRLQKQKLNADYFEQIRSYQFALHPLIHIDCYFNLKETVWRKERPWLETVQCYLKRNGLPQVEASIWQRSYEIMGDEKWISEGGGRAFLQRIGMFDQLKIIDLVEPLMFALNPARIDDPHCYHLIVENKTTFDILADILPDTIFLTLLYGAGKCFLNSITQLERQLHMPDAQHHLCYFGDLDLEGITIWYLLTKRRKSDLAMPFYRALLGKTYHQGKENQRKDNAAYQAFLSCFTESEQKQIQQLFANQGYYPQEALSAQELQAIGRGISWKDI